jgi:hypothetical protein
MTGPGFLNSSGSKYPAKIFSGKLSRPGKNFLKMFSEKKCSEFLHPKKIFTKISSTKKEIQEKFR